MRRLLLVLLAALPAAADVLPVLPGESVQAALERARPGDVVRLAPGVHRERVYFPRSGEHGAPVVLEGEPGAILDGSEPVTLDWRPAPDIAPGVWRAALSFEPMTVTADGKGVTLLREDRVADDDGREPIWRWPRLFSQGVRDDGFRGVQALAMYRREPGELLVRFAGDLDPRGLAFTAAPKEACVAISDVDRCVVRGLTLRNTWYGVYIERSLGSVVERCVIGPVDHGVWLDTGADRCTVRFNEIFWSPIGGADPYREGSWDHWQAHKTGGHYDRYGVQIRHTDGGHEIHDNFIHDHWDGIEDVGNPGENVGLRIHHNRIVTLEDDGLEPNGAEEDCQWYDNLVINTRCGFRIKAPERGPLYAYGNIYLRNKEDYRNYGEIELKPAEVYVYHNTSTSTPAIMSNKVFGIGTPNYHYHNNLFFAGYWWGNSGRSVPPNWHGDYNVYVRRGDDKRWDEGRALAAELGLDGHSVWATGDPGFVDLDNGNVALRPTSPARGAGGDLRALLGRDLPGLRPGERPDAGALAFGQPMPALPRPADAVEAPPAGDWPPADARRVEPWTGANLLDNGGFEQGFAGWGEPDPRIYSLADGAAPEGDKRLVIRVEDDTAGISRLLEGLEPGKDYVLLYRSRLNTLRDGRIIVRDLRTSYYLNQGQPQPGSRWRTTVLRFTAPDNPVRLEISPRSPGGCELDAFALYAAR